MDVNSKSTINVIDTIMNYYENTNFIIINTFTISYLYCVKCIYIRCTVYDIVRCIL